MADETLRCEVCSGTAFDDVYLPDTWGVQAIRTKLKACKDCRFVLLPPLGRPPNIKPSLSMSLKTYGQNPLSTEEIVAAIESIRAEVGKYRPDERWARRGDKIVITERGKDDVCILRHGDVDRLDLVASCDPYRLRLLLDELSRRRL